MKRALLTHATGLAVAGAFLAGPMTGCEDLPGTREQQGTVIGGATGAVAGAAISEENRLLGALIGGLLGAGGGYLIGSNVENIREDDVNAARAASVEAQQNPATPDDVYGSVTADLDNDGFVTLDEVVAMEEAGLSDEQMLDRLRATNQVFVLTQDQRQFLINRGVSPDVVAAMDTINQNLRQQLVQEQRQQTGVQGGTVISEPR